MNYKEKFNIQRRQAKARDIDWQLTYEQWLNVWISSGHLHERGNRKGQYCMSRKGDTGPYSIDNIFIQLHGQNVSDAHLGKLRSKEHRQKLSSAGKGKSAWNKGKSLGPLSEETRQKMSIAHKGRSRGPHSEQTRQKMSAAKKKYHESRRNKELT